MFPLVLRKLFADNTDKIDWWHLSTNPAAIDYLRSHPYGIDWIALCSNSAAIDQIKAVNNLEFWGVGLTIQINWDFLSSNSAALDLIKSNLWKINWDLLSSNPAAIDILKANPYRICWDLFVYLPEAIDMINEHLLETNYNPTLFEMGISKTQYLSLSFIKKYAHEIVPCKNVTDCVKIETFLLNTELPIDMSRLIVSFV